MRLPENHLAVRVLAEYSDALLNAAGKPIVNAATGVSLVEADDDTPADEELIAKPGMVAICEVLFPCEIFTQFPEVLEVDGEIYGSELFEPEVFAGDTIAVKQSEIDLDTPMLNDGISDIFAVPYSALLCVIDGPRQLRPVGGYTMATAVYPHDTVRELVEGKMDRVRKKPNGVIFEYKVPPLSGQAQLVFVGAPLIGHDHDLLPGQRVVYNRWTTGPKYRIQNEDYYCVRHPDIALLLPADADVVSMGEARYSRTVKRPIRGN